MKLRKVQCNSCPFLPNGLKISPREMARIHGDLLQGVNHLCHSDRSNNTICRGGRQVQLQMWCSLGRISAPTNQALAEAMRAHGVEPAAHISDKQ